MSQKKIARAALGVLAGALLYFILVLLPLAGPLLSGIAAGRTAKTGARNGFLLGVLSGVAGAMLWAYVFYAVLGFRAASVLSWVFLAVSVLWNVLAILFCGVGGVFGSMVSMTEEIFSDAGKDYRRNVVMHSSIEDEACVHTVIVCPECSTACPEEDMYCINCGAKIEGDDNTTDH
jgi:hypothetical protein